MEPTATADGMFEIAIIGGGISGTYTLLLLLETVASRPRRESPVRIAFVDRRGEIGTGTPYGSRSAYNNLIITTLDEFVPDEDRAAFLAWLSDHRADWTEAMRRDPGGAAARWVDDNAGAIAAGRFEELYVPRRLFGDYLSAVARRAIAEAEIGGLALVSLVAAEAVDLVRSDEGYKIALDSGGPVSAGQVVLAVGSPPVRSLARLLPDALSPDILVDDPYLPSFDATMETVRRAILSGEGRASDVLLVGTNASALELVYALAHDRRLAGRLGTIVAMSPSGAFPHPISRTATASFRFARMDALLAGPPCGARDIIEAAEADVAAAIERGEPVADGFHDLGRLLVEVLDRQPVSTVKAFHRDCGMRFSRLIRRAGSDYSTAAADLVATVRMRVVAGAVHGFGRARDGLTVEYAGEPGGGTRTDPGRFAAVVNCCGFEELSDRSSSPLIRRLVASGLGRPNATGRGFTVDTDLRMAPGAFVLGPLLGGVFNERFRLWHVENARRIRSLAPVVAEGLVAGLEDPTDERVLTMERVGP